MKYRGHLTWPWLRWPDRRQLTFGRLASLLGSLLLLGGSARGAVAPGPDAFGYTVTPTTNFTFLQITNVLEGSKRVLWFDDDTPFTVTNIGFTFSFYGSNHTSVSFNVNGLMTFGGESADPANVNLTATSPTNDQPCIAVLWDDWETKYYGNEDAVYYRTAGTPGSRQFIVQWNKVDPIYGPGIDPVIFEVRLFEGSDRILCSYLDTVVSDDATNPPIASLGIGATVGIRDTSGHANDHNLQWSFNQGVITNGLNLLFSPPNHPPVATNDNVVLTEDTPSNINVLGNDSDLDGDSLTVIAITQGTNGVAATNVTGTITYSPVTNFFGTDHFSYHISDGRGGNSTGQVSIIVTPVNDAPVANSQSIATPEDMATNLVLTASDVESTNLIFAILSGPTNGVLSLLDSNSGAATYTPNTNYDGADFFTFTVSDGSLLATGQVTVAITPVNDAPATFSQSRTNAEDTALPITLTAFDVDGPVTNFTLVSLPAHGSLIGAGADLIYQPATNYHGLDGFTFSVNDGALTSAVATVSLTVTPVNDAPVAINDDLVTAEDTPISFNVLTNDIDLDGDSLVVVGLTLATNGVLAASINGTVAYSPATNFFGTDHFTYNISDGRGGSASGEVSLTVTPVNDPPVALAQSVTTPEDTATNLVLTATDVDNTNLTFALLGAPTNGVLSLLDTNSGAVTYTPNTNYNGADFFTFTVSDGSLLATGQVSIVVTPVNDAPAAYSQSVTTLEDTATNLVLTATDVDGTNLTFALLSAPTNGALSLLDTNTGAVTYTPNTNYNGVDFFTFTVSDGSLFATGQVSITVLPVNDAPVAPPQNVTTLEDTVTNLVLTGSDVDGDSLMVVAITLASNGVLAANFNGTVAYFPATNFFGTDHFTYNISDGRGGSATGQVSITVIAVNDAPVADSQSVTTPEDTATNLVLTATDVDSTNLTFTLLTAPTNGVLSVLDTNTGEVIYAPPTNYHGADFFDFTVSDGSLLATGQISIIVTPVNDPPVAGDDAVDTCREVTLMLPEAVLLANDTDLDAGDVLSITNVSATSSIGGTVGLLAGTVTYISPTNFVGQDTFTYTVSDGNGGSATGTVMVRVWPPLSIMGIAPQTNGSMMISFCGTPGGNYVMEGSTDFTSWTNLGSLTEGGAGVFQFEDAATSGVDARFYRVLLP